MNDTVPPDPFKTLGVTREATENEIKSAYRKGCLRCHPDKTTDPDKIAEFHQIQQAFDILGDPEKRQKYEDSIRLQQLRRDMFNRKGSDDPRRPDADSRSASYSYARFDERRPKPSASPESFSRRGSEDLFSDSRAQRKYHDDYEPIPRRTSTTQKPAAPASKTSKSTKEQQKDRDLRSRQRERDLERERARRFTHAEGDSSDDSRERRMRQRDMDEMHRRHSSRSDEDDRDVKGRAQRAAPPPSSYRSEAFSSENIGVRRDSKSSSTRPAMVRPRSSSSKARDLSPPSPRRSASRREYSDAPPSLFSSRSNPADIKPPPRRAHTSDNYDDGSRFTKPGLPRSETMPIRPSVSTRRTTSSRVPEQRDTLDSGYGSATISPLDAYAAPPSASRTKQYRFSDHDDSDDPGFNSEIRRPAAARRRSPSPVKRYASTSAVPKYAPSVTMEKERGPPPSRSASYKTAAPSSPQQPVRRPSLQRSGSSYERRGSSLRREQTMPAAPIPPIKTGFSSSNERLFGEVLSSSPTELSRSPFSSRKETTSARRIPREVSDNPVRRSSRDVEYSPGTRTPVEGLSSQGLGSIATKKKWEDAMRQIQRQREHDGMGVRGRAREMSVN